MKTMYRVSKWGIEIKPIEVIKETDKFVTVKRTGMWNKPIREQKHTSWSDTFETWEQAKAHLEERYTKELDYLNGELLGTQSALAKVQAMQKPEEQP